MTTITPSCETATDWPALVRQLGASFAARAATADQDDAFVAENFATLKAHGFLAAAVPAEFGGGGAGMPELCATIREIARHCGSTALAFAMHTHVVAVAAWRWQYQQAPVEGLLKRVAGEQLQLVSSGGSDWLQSSGSAVEVEGGFRVNARKAFASGVPSGDLLVTSAVLQDGAGGTVLHFAVPLRGPGVAIEPTWRALGMHGTGSHDVVLRDVFVPAAAISGRRPAGKWHMLFHVITMIALPIIYAAYLGVAEAARARALALAGKRATQPYVVEQAGLLETEIAAARLAHADMLAAACEGLPGFATTNRVAIGRALVVRSVLRAVELALEVAGGAGFYRAAELERMFRDAQAARYHPLQPAAQLDLAGRVALDLEMPASA